MPEQNLLIAFLDRLYRDLGMLNIGGKVNLSGRRGFKILLDACDYVFDDKSRDDAWSFRWVLHNLKGEHDTENTIRQTRDYILQYWTLERTKLMLES